MNAELAASALGMVAGGGRRHARRRRAARLAEAEARRRIARSPRLNPRSLPADALPDTLDAFRAWLATMPLPFPTIGARLEPAGDPSAALMVMIDMPSPERRLVRRRSRSPVRSDAGGDERAEPRQALSRAAVAGASAQRHGSIRPARAGSARSPATMSGWCGRARCCCSGTPAPSPCSTRRSRETRGRWHEVETPAGPVRTVATIRPEQIGGRAPIRKMVWEDLQRVMEELQ